MRTAHLGRTARLALGGLSTGLLLLVSGCVEPSAAAPSGPLPTMPSGSDLTSKELISYAEQALLGDCLREHGFEYYPVDPSNEAASQSKDPNIRYLEGLSESDQLAYRQAMFGDTDESKVQATVEGVTTQLSTNGCLADARKQLYGDLEAWYRPHVIAGNIDSLAHRDVLADPRYQKDEQTRRELARHYAAAVRAKYRTELDRLDAIEDRAADRAREILRDS